MLSRFLTVLSIALVTSGFALIGSKLYFNNSNYLSPVIERIEKEILPLNRYSIENLKNEEFQPQNFVISEQISDPINFSSQLFYLQDKESSVSGLINIPKINFPRGIILLLRGYVPLEIFESGTGTKRIGEKLAESGFITVAPDFLGYGKSSNPSNLPLEERFQTYTTMLTLLNSIPNIATEIKSKYPDLNIENLTSNIGLFGHSNGGHIALAILEITGKNIPTVLWAPVGKPFPFSILAYTDEYDDKGKALRKLISDFEKDYDITKYSIDVYFDLINAPLQIHQGLDDQEVPYWWSEELVGILKSKDKEVTYFAYPGQDHNFNQGSWETLATRTVNFYIKHFKFE